MCCPITWWIKYGKATEPLKIQFNRLKHENNWRKYIFTKQIKPTNMVLKSFGFNILKSYKCSENTGVGLSKYQKLKYWYWTPSGKSGICASLLKTLLTAFNWRHLDIFLCVFVHLSTHLKLRVAYTCLCFAPLWIAYAESRLGNSILLTGQYTFNFTLLFSIENTQKETVYHITWFVWFESYVGRATAHCFKWNGVFIIIQSKIKI